VNPFKNIMTNPAQILRVACRWLLPAAALFLTGCQSARSTTEVISPPPPLRGSSPIAAYDSYALALDRQYAELRSTAIALAYSGKKPDAPKQL
jgi:hypothetical protein